MAVASSFSISGLASLWLRSARPSQRRFLFDGILAGWLWRAPRKPESNKTLFEVRPSPNKGLGVFATVPIPYDTVVMHDELLLRYEKEQPPQETYRTFLKLPSPIQEEVLKLSVRQDEERYLKLGLKLMLEREREDLIPKILLLEEVLSTNAFDIFIDELKSPGGLFLTASRINHSCVPNADHSYDDKSGYKSVFANRDIHAGEEITISYINHYNSRALRQMELRTWGFVCRCPACDKNHPRSGAYEQRLQRLEQLHQDDCMDNTGRLKASASLSGRVLEGAAKQAQQRIDFLTKTGYLRKLSRQANLGAFDIALAQYKLSKLPYKLTDAIRFLELVIELDLKYYGETHAFTREDQRLCCRLKKGYVP